MMGELRLELDAGLCKARLKAYDNDLPKLLKKYSAAQLKARGELILKCPGRMEDLALPVQGSCREQSSGDVDPKIYMAQALETHGFI